jgi:ketosteroid isomerase-like protein
VTGRYSLSAPQKDGSKKQDRGKYLQVWERQPGGEWRIVAASFSSDLAP